LLYSWLQHRRQYLGQGRVAGHACADQPQHFRLELRILVKLLLPRDALIKLVIGILSPKPPDFSILKNQWVMLSVRTMLGNQHEM